MLFLVHVSTIEMIVKKWETHELRHGNTGLKIFVVLIPEEGLAATSPNQSFCWYGTDYGTLLLYRLYFIVGVKPKEGMGELMPARSSFCMTTTKILRPVLTWHSSFHLMCMFGFRMSRTQLHGAWMEFVKTTSGEASHVRSSGGKNTP